MRSAEEMAELNPPFFHNESTRIQAYMEEFGLAPALKLRDPPLVQYTQYQIRRMQGKPTFQIFAPQIQDIPHTPTVTRVIPPPRTCPAGSNSEATVWKPTVTRSSSQDMSDYGTESSSGSSPEALSSTISKKQTRKVGAAKPTAAETPDQTVPSPMGSSIHSCQRSPVLPKKKISKSATKKPAKKLEKQALQASDILVAADMSGADEIEKLEQKLFEYDARIKLEKELLELELQIARKRAELEKAKAKG